MKWFVFLIVAALISCSGCADLYTTNDIRARANSEAQIVAAYAQQQQARINKLNTDYVHTYNRLNDQLVTLGRQELTQSFTLDALRATDSLIADPNATLRGRFRDSTQTTVSNERAEMDAVDASIAQARNAYADSYSQATLDMAKLKAVESNLSTLAQSEQETKDIQDLIKKVYSAYQAVQKEETKPSK